MSPLTAEQIQELLDDDTVLLEYTLGEKRSALWVVTADSVTSFSLPAQQQIEMAAENAAGCCSKANSAAGSATRNYRRGN